jgi:hypothetical protein
MGSGIGFLHRILKDETRRKIVLLLNERGALSYTDLIEELGFINNGLLNYHLKQLDCLLTKDVNGKYTLTEKGKLATRLLTLDSSNIVQAVPQTGQTSKIFVTREFNWRVISVGLIALFSFFLNLYIVITVGESVSVLGFLSFSGIFAFLFLVLHPIATKIKVTKDGIDWRIFSMGTFIHYGELKEIQVHRFCLKLDIGKIRNICPVDRNGFLAAVREAKPDLKIVSWKQK